MARAVAATPIVLIGDDDPDTRGLVALALADPRWRLIVAVNGDEALRLADEYRPVVAVLNLTMPGRAGLELIAAMRAAPPLRRTYLIVLTGQARADTAEAALAAGADRYLTKPFSPEALRRAVGQRLELA